MNGVSSGFVRIPFRVSAKDRKDASLLMLRMKWRRVCRIPQRRSHRRANGTTSPRWNASATERRRLGAVSWSV